MKSITISRHRKEISISVYLSNVMFIVMWVINALNIFNVDYIDGYATPYYDVSKNYFEVGFKYLNILGAKFGLSFFQFRLIIVSLTLILLKKSIEYYTKKPALIVGFYFLYPFLLQCVQIRNAFSASIVLFAFRYLDGKHHKGVIKFVLFVLLASTIHKLSLIYIVFALTYKVSLKKITHIAIGYLILLWLLIYFFKSKIVFLLYKIISDERLLFYFDINNKRFLVKSMLPYLLIFIFLIWISLSIRKNKKNFHEKEKNIILIKGCIAILSFLPLFLIDGNYFRIWAFLLPIIYCIIINSADYSREKLCNKKWRLLFCCVMAIGMFFIELGPYDPVSFENVTIGVLKNNLILEWLMY